MTKAGLYFDANTFIHAFERRDDIGKYLLEFLYRGGAEPPYKVVTSELTLAEVLVKPIRDKNRNLQHIYEATLRVRTGWFHVKGMDSVILRAAASLRASNNALKLPDAIHLASALETGCRYFLSNDRRISGAMTDVDAEAKPLVVSLELQELQALRASLS